MNIHDFIQMKINNQKITMITCYDYAFAKIMNQGTIDCILVGDSVAMVMHGFESTLYADIPMMVQHTQAVKRGAPNKFIIADLPFLSYRSSLSETLANIDKLMKAGAQAVKLEGGQGNFETIEHITQSGIPVMGHLGLTPQFVHQLGGYKVQGREKQAQEQILRDALSLEKAGCFAIVLECVPAQLASDISQALQIPTIGIGAGVQVDGQVLVLHDMLGLNIDFKAKFVKSYLNGSDFVNEALNAYIDEVKNKVFPGIEHSFT